jgi:hypothetical protein
VGAPASDIFATVRVSERGSHDAGRSGRAHPHKDLLPVARRVLELNPTPPIADLLLRVV